MFYDLTESKVNIGGMDLDYVSFGKGKMPLILIQGLSVKDVKGAGVSIAFRYRLFAKRYRVYMFDRRPVVPDEITIWDLADDIYRAMNHLGIRSADILGVSQGGMIAMALAIDHPECVHRMVLGVTTARPPESTKKIVKGWVRCAGERDHETINKEVFSLMYTERYLRKYRSVMPLLIKTVRPRDYRRFEMLAASILTFDCYEKLGKIKCPVYVIGAALDKIVPCDASRRIAQKLDCSMYIYDEYGHAVFDEAKDFNRRVYDFLTEQEVPNA